MQRSLDAELQQLLRTAPYAIRIKSIRNNAGLMIQSNEEERHRFDQCRDRLLKVGEIISLNANILRKAAEYETSYDLTPQDAIVYASVITHLRQGLSEQACFLNRNSKDFDNPDIIDELGEFNCRLIPRFDHGYAFIQSRITS